MSRTTPHLLALLALAGLPAGCTVAGPRAGGAAAVEARDREPEVAVGLAVDAAWVDVTATGEFELADEGGATRARSRAGRAWRVRREGGGVAAESDGETVRVRESLLVRTRDEGSVVASGKRYRGALLLRPGAGGVTVVNLLELETYLLGVVPLEIGKDRPPEELEAVKAQAVAARTYAIRHRGRRAELGFDYHGSVMDQAYGGAEAEDAVASRAVRETRGQILTYDGEPIEAYYHSTCGGRTAALDEVWPGEPRPYLRSVSDARSAGGSYCETSNRFRWTERWDRNGLMAALNRGLAERGVRGTVREIRSLEVTGRTPSGRAEALRIETDLGEHRVRGDSIRWVLRPEPGRILNSSAIQLAIDRQDGEIMGLMVTGSGWGHGIGMCQVGALGRARDGQSYRDILLTYYPGTRIARLYR